MKRTRNKKKKIYVYSTIVILAVLLFFVGRGVSGIYEKNRVSAQRRADLNAELKELQDRRDELESMIDSLQTERGLEEEIRTKFQVSKPGEKSVILVDPDTSGEEEDVEEKSAWESFKNLFK
jgi:cell division protein FtsB